MIPLAASARSGGGWYRGRLIAALLILAATSTLYVWVLAEYADFSDWL